MRTLFFFQLKKQLRLALLFGLLMAIFSVTVVFLFDDESGRVLDELRAQAPGIFEAFRIYGSLGLLDYMISLLYGFLIPALGSLLAVIVSSRLLPAQIQTGELTYYLALPVSRYRLVLVKAAVVAACLVIALFINSGVTVLAVMLMKPQAFNLSWFFVLSIGTLFLFLMSTGIAMMIACLAQERQRSNRLSLLVYFSLFILSMIGQVKAFPGFLKYLSIYSLWNTQALLTGRILKSSLLMPLIG
ncbi:MAG: ABC transporter permease subunit, partial [Clostridiales bacterium]|nr:ABC transporter permease subunit [Clostridiales bacterium]